MGALGLARSVHVPKLDSRLSACQPVDTIPGCLQTLERLTAAVWLMDNFQYLLVLIIFQHFDSKPLSSPDQFLFLISTTIIQKQNHQIITVSKEQRVKLLLISYAIRFILSTPYNFGRILKYLAFISTHYLPFFTITSSPSCAT